MVGVLDLHVGITNTNEANMAHPLDAGLRLCSIRAPLARASRDMKLQSILLGGVILTKPCVSPQVFHGSMRLTGGGRVATTVRGVEPSRKCIKPGSLKPGES